MDQSPTAHVFFEPGVVRAWVEAYLPLRKIQPRFCVATGPHEEKAFLPLILDCGGWKDLWLRQIVPVGSSEFDYHDPIADRPMSAQEWSDLWEAIWREVQVRWKDSFDVFILPRLRGHVMPPKLGTVVDEVPIMDLNVSDMASLLSGGRHRKFRYNIKKKIQKIEAAGNASLRMVDSDDLPAALLAVRLFAEHHQKRWPDASTPRSYYENLARHCLDQGYLTISQLFLGTNPISWRIGFEYHKRHCLYQRSFDESKAGLSPGTLHCYMIVKRALERGCHLVDFGRGKEAWKFQWTDKTFPLRQLQWRNGRWASVLIAWQQSVRPKLVFLKRLVLGRKAKS